MRITYQVSHCRLHPSRMMPDVSRLVSHASRLKSSVSRLMYCVLPGLYVSGLTRYQVCLTSRTLHLTWPLSLPLLLTKQQQKTTAFPFFHSCILRSIGGNDQTNRPTDGRTYRRTDGPRARAAHKTEAHRCSILRSISSASIITTTDAALVWRRAEFDGTL